MKNSIFRMILYSFNIENIYFTSTNSKSEQTPNLQQIQSESAFFVSKQNKELKNNLSNIISYIISYYCK
jgi:hypothetical protein